MNDEQVQKFLREAISLSKNSDQGYCKRGASDCSGKSASDKYSSIAAAKDPFTLTTYNPSFTGSLHGFRIDRQIYPSLFSSLKVESDDTNAMAVVTTENVLQFTANFDLQSQNAYSIDQFKSVDGQDVDLLTDSATETPKKFLTVKCLRNWQSNFSSSYGDWKCRKFDADDQQIQSGDNWDRIVRLESQLGPMRRVAEQPFAILFDPAICPESLAVFLANQFLLTSDTPSPVLTWQRRGELNSLGIKNFIFLGGWNSSAGQDFIDDEKLQMRRWKCALAPLVAATPGSAFVSLAPAGLEDPDGVALVFLAIDSRGLRDAVIGLSSPTIPPMARSPFSNWLPDYLVIKGGLETASAAGPGGFSCAGYYDNHWQFRNELSSCVCVQ
ncbi:hypothetical protein BOX15_Mlig010965g1 [Macrostomum lignano]|nr:hypothetical protein BOX15_Mlig010965g1 [Macrostomum lignano]